MGQFLAVGLSTAFSVPKESVSDMTSLENAIRSSPRLDTQLYDRQETSQSYRWTLRPEVLESQLLPFLADFYPAYYQSTAYYEAVRENIEDKKAAEILSYAERKPEEAFQRDDYAMPARVAPPDSPLAKPLRLARNFILLAMEGKIVMESYHTMFDFFTDSIQRRFSEHELARALQVYITG